MKETATGLWPVAFQHLASHQIDEMNPGISEASHRFILVTVVGFGIEPVLHFLIGHRTSKDQIPWGASVHGRQTLDFDQRSRTQPLTLCS